MNNLRIVDLFAGCGGMSLGFMKAGFEVVAAFDNWLPAIEVYKENFNHAIYNEDLKNLDVADKIKNHFPDIIVGGPPCQDFSSAGHRNETLGRADLTYSFTDIICKTQPKFFVMENVDRITKSGIYQDIIKQFRNTGYGLTSIILDASYCGVPQKRKRFFLIGEFGGQDDFLNDSLQENQSKSPMTMHDYLGDELGVEFYFRIPRSYNRRAIFSIHKPSVTIRGVDRPIPKTYKKHPGDLVGIGEQVRALTVKERSYIQTFPRNFNFIGTKTNLNQMIGNAVPVELANYVAENLSKYIQNKSL
ncbi:DNA cytosine methyltransferase [Flavobacteriales bacterium]|nr:DNA cytosine methyltransferase [Flavobacteriales bacterium]